MALAAWWRTAQSGRSSRGPPSAPSTSLKDTGVGIVRWA